MKAQGSLATRDFPELVHELSVSRWTGRLILSHAGVGKSLNVQEGRLVFASSTSPDERLGELLLRRGRISWRQLVDAAAAIVPGKRLGAILVEQGALTPPDLIKGVVEHTREIIYGAFLWTEGQYRLQPETPGDESITLRMSTPDIILEGVRRIQAWSRIERGVGGLATRYVRAPDYESVVAHMTLSEPQLALLTSLHGVEDVETICRESELDDFEVCQLLWAARVIGLVRRVDRGADGASEVEDEGLGFVLDGE